MHTITFDIPLLVGGLALLVGLRIWGSRELFQVACQVVGTLWAQYSIVVNWSLGKLVPLFSASVYSGRLRHTHIYYPFIAFTVFGACIGSLFWDVPVGIPFAYGQGRVWVQLAVFLSLVLSTRAFADAMSRPEGPFLMWKGLILIGLVHGTAFLYQYFAAAVGLPAIGVSRAHGLTINGDAGDLAAFSVEGVTDILRPGGLAGEPKTVAVLFALVLATAISAGAPASATNLWKLLARTSALLSAIGLVGAFATSAYVGFSAVLLALTLLGLIRSKRYVGLAVVVLGGLLFANELLRALSLPSLYELLRIRLTDRIAAGDMDPPVSAALQILARSPVILFLGTGLGGGTFSIQRILNTGFEYASTPNVGIVALLLELGLVGTLLLLSPFAISVLSTRLRLGVSPHMAWEPRFLLTLGTSAMILMLSGSGIALGFPMAVGCTIACAGIVHRNKPYSTNSRVG